MFSGLFLGTLEQQREKLKSSNVIRCVGRDAKGKSLAGSSESLRTRCTVHDEELTWGLLWGTTEAPPPPLVPKRKDEEVAVMKKVPVR